MFLDEFIRYRVSNYFSIFISSNSNYLKNEPTMNTFTGSTSKKRVQIC